MTDLTIADLPVAATLTGTELLHVVQGGNSRQVRADKLPAWGVQPGAASALAYDDSVTQVGVTNAQELFELLLVSAGLVSSPAALHLTGA